MPGPHPGDHSHRPLQGGWVGGWVGTSNTPCRCLCTQAAPILHSYINKLYRHYNKHSTQTRSVHTAIAMPQQYQYFTSLNKTIEREGLSMPKPNQTEDNHPSHQTVSIELLFTSCRRAPGGKQHYKEETTKTQENTRQKTSKE